MAKSYLEQSYWIYLDTLPLMTLRNLGRKVGVATATSLNKEALIEAIIGLITGKESPAPRSKRGAPAKQSYIDPEVLEKLDQIRRENERAEEDDYLMVEASEQRSAFDEPIYSGILEITASGYGFLRTNNCQPTMGGGDVFLAASSIHNYKLREGDFVTCTVTPRQKNESPALDQLLSVNGKTMFRYEERQIFEQLTAQYAKQKISLSEGSDALSVRILDLFVPIGRGQRALIIAPPKAGKTTLLKEIGKAVETAHRDIRLIVLLIDERPEEVTDIRSELRDAEVIYSTFDEGAEHHVRAAQLTIAHAKRLAEQGEDVLILLDSLTKLTRAYNYLAEGTGRTLSGGLDMSALAEPKRFFGTARNTVEGGSVTILATALVETGSRMDDVIYEEFKGTGNADIFLSRELAERRIYPAIDLRRSGTRKEELLLNAEELDAVYRLREHGLPDNSAGVIDMMKRTENNAEFIRKLPEWLKLYK